MPLTLRVFEFHKSLSFWQGFVHSTYLDVFDTITAIAVPVEFFGVVSFGVHEDGEGVPDVACFLDVSQEVFEGVLVISTGDGNGFECFCLFLPFIECFHRLFLE